jgi:hypothetical protein
VDIFALENEIYRRKIMRSPHMQPGAIKAGGLLAISSAHGG